MSFICGMIAHYMGAISISEVELKHGSNAQAREMAQKTIDAQNIEIVEMTKRLETNVKLNFPPTGRTVAVHHTGLTDIGPAYLQAPQIAKVFPSRMADDICLGIAKASANGAREDEELPESTYDKKHVKRLL
ncbi:DUF305 domain-containing protein [Rhizobium wenxiniae]|uniref:DUF305 domain-containing protein n=1 Tax=Rhizobium wenxiniae TaxID=1737357 RepID=UPI003C28C3AD